MQNNLLMTINKNIMKPIKYILSTIMLLGVIVSNAQQSYFSYAPTNEWVYPSYDDITVYTPKGTPVYVLKWLKNDWTQNTKTHMIGYYQGQYGNRLTYEAEATVKYNCHTYAWTGANSYWMNPPNQEEYWDDGSYQAVLSVAPGTKVHYLLDDHSAVIVDINYYSSKWGPGPRFKHQKNDSPYNATSLEYYAGPSISGPVAIKYPGSVTPYSLANPRPGTITWEKSAGSPFNISPTTGGTTNVTQTAGSGTGTLTAKINGTVVATKTITASTATISGTMSGPDIVYAGQGASFFLPHVLDLTYTWSVYGYLEIAGSNGFSSCSFYVPPYASGSSGSVNCIVSFNGATIASFSKSYEVY